MKNFIYSIFIIILFTSCADNSKIGKYTKEPLPENFKYVITKDESNVALEKNQIYVQLSEKLTEGQIATLAEELFNSKDKQRRFYIYYSLINSNDDEMVWAISHFDPELEITINGSTATQEIKVKENASKVDGKIIGMFYEEEFTSASYTVFEKDNKIFVKNLLKNGQSTQNEMIESKVENGKKLEFKDGLYNGEYYILTNNNQLEFYNKENKNFTTAIEIK